MGTFLLVFAVVIKQKKIKGLLVEAALKEPGLLKQHRTTATY